MSELDTNEFFDVYRVFCPDATREEFELEWARFQEAKAAHRKEKSLQ